MEFSQERRKETHTAETGSMIVSPEAPRTESKYRSWG